MSRLAVVEGGYVFPARSDGTRPFAVCDVHGAPVPEAQTTVKHSIIMPRYIPQALRQNVERRQGVYLFAGMYLPHFGHFVLESLSRLWAVERLTEPLDGIVFLNAGRNPPNSAKYANIFKALGVNCSIHVITSPTQFERLYVPEQGLGMGPTATGLVEQRDFLRRHFTAMALPVAGHDKIYISRRAYGLKRGGMLGEAYFERSLEQAGYHVFHPQREPLGVQIGTYLAASKIVSPDNSALHVAGFVARPDQKIAIVLRRKHGAVDLFPQLSVAMQHEPLVIDAIKQVLVHTGRRPANWGHYAELDLASVYAKLVEHGFIDLDVVLEVPRWRDVKRDAERMVRRFGGTLAKGDLTADKPELLGRYF